MRFSLLNRQPICASCLAEVKQYGRIATFSSSRHLALGKPQRDYNDKYQLPQTPARTRFAPSPTGYLHLGSLRTALFNYLLAKATGGQFLLRIEDTDRTRLVADAESRLYEDLKWAGLSWAEGPDVGGDYGPYKQSERLGIYAVYAQQLLDSGRAYRCFCSKETLDLQRQHQSQDTGIATYPGTCRSVGVSESDRRAANGEPFTIRFRASETPVSAPDLVYGRFKKAETEGDFIIMKSDGFPSYHFANVVDDHLMQITHVVRGAEWLISTPKHVELYNAFGWTPPQFAHVGLLVDSKRQKLSKRNMEDIGIAKYKADMILPPALLNYAVLLGWNPNLQQNPTLNQQGVLTLPELEKNFSLRFTRGDTIVDPARLPHLQQKHIELMIKSKDTSPLKTELLAKPIAAALLQHQRAQVDYVEAHLECKREVTEEMPNAGFYDSLGQRTRKASPPEYEPENIQENIDDFIMQALRISNTRTTDPEVFLSENRYLFWAPPLSLVAKGTVQFTDQLAKSTRANEQAQNLDWEFRLSEEVPSEEQDLPRALNRLTNILSRTKPWDHETISASMKNFIDEVAKELLSPKPGVSWDLMRLVLLGYTSGPSIVPLMELLGRREVLYRLKGARMAAEKWQEEKDRTGREGRRDGMRRSRG